MRKIDLLLTIIAAFLIASGFNLFFLPFDFAINIVGIGLIVNYYFAIKIYAIVGIINLVSVIICYYYFDKRLAKKSILAGVFLIPIFLFIIPVKQIVDDPMLSLIYGGVLTGFGLGLLYYAKQTIGTMAIIANLMVKYLNLSYPQALFIANGIIISFSVLIFNLQTGLYAFLALLVIHYVEKYLETGINKGYQIQIISKNYEHISKIIVDQTSSGVTLLLAEGGYTHKNTKVVSCAVTSSELKEIRQIVRSNDRDAIIIVAPASSIYGRKKVKFFKKIDIIE